MLPGFLAVDEDFGFLVDTVEVELYFFSLRSLEDLAVLSFAAGVPAAARACGARLGQGSCVDVPVVWQVYIH